MFGYEVLFVHGAWAGPWVWGSWAAHLAAEGWAVRSLTLPGHAPGESEFPHGLQAYADYVAGSMDRPEKTVLVGHSMGGWACLRVLERQRCAASVLLAPVPLTGVPARTRNALVRMDLWGGLRTLLLGRPAVLPDRLVRTVCFTPQTPEATVERFRSRLVPESARATRQMAWMGLTGPRVDRRRLARTQEGVPHLVLASPGDFFFRPEEVRDTAAALGASLEVVEGYPHCMMEVDEDRALVCRVDGWLRAKLGYEPSGPPLGEASFDTATGRKVY